MNLNRKTELALDLVFKLKDGKTVSVTKLASELKTTVDYLQQIANKLRKGNLIESVRGPGGGIRRTRSVIKAYEVFEVMGELKKPGNSKKTSERVKEILNDKLQQVWV